MNLPNRITAGRIALALAGGTLLAVQPAAAPGPRWETWTAFVLFLAAELTDYLDGKVARARGEVTAAGRILDPLADKILVTGALILFLRFDPLLTDLLPPWVVAVVVLRELAVTSLRGLVERRGIPFGADPTGKWKMIAQCVLIQAMLAYLGGWVWCRPIAAAFVWIVLGLTVISGAHYVRKAADVLRR